MLLDGLQGLTESLACQKSPPNQVTEERVLAIAEDLEDCLEARNVADATVKGMVRLSVDFAVTLGEFLLWSIFF